MRFFVRNPGRSNAETVRRFLEQLPPDRPRLAPTNEQRTLSNALSEFRHQADVYWLKDFDPSAELQT